MSRTWLVARPGTVFDYHQSSVRHPIEFSIPECSPDAQIHRRLGGCGAQGDGRGSWLRHWRRRRRMY